ncbi:MAG: T9SS type A sorting domain-containing protein [Bacteroidales bacterium]|nr:T9SS type A sorting domain-containing protein [Bacteroidales bacterium]
MITTKIIQDHRGRHHHEADHHHGGENQLRSVDQPGDNYHYEETLLKAAIAPVTATMMQSPAPGHDFRTGSERHRISRSHMILFLFLVTGIHHKAMRQFVLLLGLAFGLTPLRSQYIAEVLEYVPAPSQYMNTVPWSAPSSPASIVGGINGSLSLGGFGGYVVFRFEEAVENDPDHPFGVDFTIFGNPMPNWSEPGIVSVMNDENGNGLPDDTWYELAGADHNFSSTVRNYRVTYQNSNTDTATDVPWTDNLGHTGSITANSFYSQPYYPLQDSFPKIPADSYSLSGTMIRSTVDTGFASGIYSLKRAFGYVDNQFRGKAPYTLPDNPYTPAPENAGGDAFDISWAVDGDRNYVALDRVHFIRVHSAVNDGAGWLGQISTEITGAVMTTPDPSVAGTGELVVIREIPPVLDTTDYQLEVFAFTNGRLNPQEQIRWSSSMPGAVVDEQNVLHVSNSGELTITASLAGNANVNTSVSTFIDLALERDDRMHGQASFSVYPNPARDFIMLKGLAGAPDDYRQTSGDTTQSGSNIRTPGPGAPLPFLQIFDVAGKQVMSQHLDDLGEQLQVGHLSPGMYMLNMTSGSGIFTGKFIKQ